jgi:thioredoxin 1
MIKNTTQEQFQKDVLENDKLVVVDFWAPWCVPCKQLLPIIEEVSNQYNESQVCFYKLNADEAKEIITRFSIRSIPTIMLFKDGMFYGQLTGLQSSLKIKELIDNNI